MFFKINCSFGLESGRGFLPENTPPFRRIVVTDGSDVPCEDRSVVVYRIRGNVVIEQKNVCDVSRKVERAQPEL